MRRRLGWEVLLAVGICEACGGAFRGEPGVCTHCGSVLEPRGDIRRLPHEVVPGFVNHAEEFLAAAPLKQAASEQQHG